MLTVAHEAPFFSSNTALHSITDMHPLDAWQGGWPGGYTVLLHFHTGVIQMNITTYMPGTAGRQPIAAAPGVPWTIVLGEGMNTATVCSEQACAAMCGVCEQTVH